MACTQNLSYAIAFLRTGSYALDCGCIATAVVRTVDNGRRYMFDQANENVILSKDSHCQHNIDM